ncbi:hypothetical protein FA048_16525 [Pedobacter polaris]|uniref:Uncharacterized protein n=1 Tax=Pedobacter polaris TaxID=2571273 RepID=A0A4U1CN57_9SPHI|nr:DUF4369 domain-containing protein [Pedobacter polaris]TKC06802.1 hypothetical protein FA048_16525 [Pedobacter polaris]
MKKIILSLALLYPLLSFGQESFNISGKVGFNNAAIAILAYEANSIKHADTAKVKNGIEVYLVTH